MPTPSFPILAGGQAVKYPLTRTVTFLSSVNRFLNDQEQRWVSGTRREAFRLGFVAIPWTELSQILAFWNTMRGPAAGNWSLLVGSTTYTNCCFLGEDLQWSEANPGVYDLTLGVQQTVQLAAAASAPGPFPTFSRGMRFQLPYSQTHHFPVLTNVMPLSGAAVTHTERTANFPYCNPQHADEQRWALSYPVLEPGEQASLENHFVACQGRYAAFTFQDPTGGIHASVRYGMDALSFQYTEPGYVSVQLQLQEVFAR